MKPKDSPFRFLDAYRSTDTAVFFGRDEEINQVYDALNGVKLLLLYGPSGVGKTSLIDCGLRKRFSASDWLPITIRRGGQLLESTFQTIQEHLIIDDGTPASSADAFPDLASLTEQLFETHYTPIYYIFDQFEELLLLGSPEEQVVFFTALNELLYQRLPCRVLLVMREEFIGHLSAYEHLCPSLFQRRLRIERMGLEQVRTLLSELLSAPQYQSAFRVVDVDRLVREMLARLPDQQQEITLTNVQVFLQELWRRANRVSAEGLPVLRAELITEDDRLETLLQQFLLAQLADLESTIPGRLPLEALSLMISERNTKLQLSEAQLRVGLQANEVPNLAALPKLLTALIQRRILRVLRRGQEPVYEISHDLLALAVRQNLSEDIQLRAKASQVYRVYGEREGYFSREEIDYLRPFRAYLSYPAALGDRILASEQQLALVRQAKVRQLRRRIYLLGSLLVLAIAGGLGAYWGFRTAETQRQLVTARNYELRWRLAEIRKVEGDYPAAVEQLVSLLQEEEKPLEVKRLRDTIRQWQTVDSLVSLADKLAQQNQYTISIAQLEAALQLSPDQHLLSQLEDTRRQAYERFLEAYQLARQEIDRNRYRDSLLQTGHRTPDEVAEDLASQTFSSGS
jgi:hypothetical protein